MSSTLRPYLAGSAGAHAAALATIVFLLPRGGFKPTNVYTIDFVGPSATLLSAGAAAASQEGPAAVAPSEIPRQLDTDSISTSRHGPVALPRPSLLRGAQEEKPSASPATKASLAGPSDSKAPAPSTGGGAAGTGVTTDLANFPYPWYISQVRLMLWQSWQRRMPRFELEGAVSFSILPNGSFTDLSMESSSGDPEFDRAALQAVEAAAPFRPLPKDFTEPFLKIHLTLKSGTS